MRVISHSVLINLRRVIFIFTYFDGRKLVRGTTRMLFQIKHTLGLWENDDVIKWKYFPRYLHFVRGTQASPVDFPHKY